MMELWFYLYKTCFLSVWISCQHFKIRRFHMFTHNEELEIFYIRNLIKVHWLCYRNFQGAKKTIRNTRKRTITPPYLPLHS